MVLFRCRNKRPIKGLVRFVMTMNFSLNVMSPTSNCNCTHARGASNCPLATINWKSGGGPSFNIVCGAVLEFCVSRLPEWRWTMHPYLEAGQNLSPRNPLEKIAFCAGVFGNFANRGRNFLSLSGVTWSCGKT